MGGRVDAIVGETVVYLSNQLTVRSRDVRNKIVILRAFDLLLPLTQTSPVPPLSPSSPSSRTMIFALRLAAKGELIARVVRYFVLSELLGHLASGLLLH